MSQLSSHGEVQNSSETDSSEEEIPEPSHTVFRAVSSPSPSRDFPRQAGSTRRTSSQSHPQMRSRCLSWADEQFGQLENSFPQPASHCRPDVISVLRWPHDTPGRVLQYQRQAKFHRALTDECNNQEVIKRGAYLTKFGPRGKPSKRFFRVSTDGQELRWGPSKDKKLKKSLHLCDLLAVFPGKDYSRLAMKKNKELPWICFTLSFVSRDIQIATDTDLQFMQWLLGLQSLGPFSKNHMSRGRLLWWRAKMKSLHSPPGALQRNPIVLEFERIAAKAEYYRSLKQQEMLDQIQYIRIATKGGR